MTYENAPATKMLASCCACCARPLLDSFSVETGVGPECRKRHGYANPDVTVDPANIATVLAAAELTELELAAVFGDSTATVREVANRLVYRIALDQTSEVAARFTVALHGLGFTKLAGRVAKRLGSVTVTAEGDDLLVKAPFSDAFNNAVRGVPGQRWDRDAKLRRVPRSARVQLWTALKAGFEPGTIVYGVDKVATL